MANEITFSALLAFSKGGRRADFGTVGGQLTMTGTDFVLKTQSIGTTEEALNIGDITTPGMMCMKNLDSSNAVTLRAASGSGTAGNCITIKAGETQLFRLGSTAPFMIASNAAVEVNYLLLEE